MVSEKGEIMKLFLFLFFIILELVLIIGLVSFSGINRNSSVEAYHQWKQKPSQETKYEWEKQSHILQKDNFTLEMILLSLLITNTSILIAFIIYIIKLKKKAHCKV